MTLIKYRFFPYSWHIDKYQTEVTVIRVYGLDTNNKSVCVQIQNFTPYVYIQLSDNIKWNEIMAKKVIDTIEKKLVIKDIEGNIIEDHRPCKSQLVYRRKLYYANINHKGEYKKFPFIFMAFFSTRNIEKLLKIVRYKQFIQGLGMTQFKVHEHNADPILQLCCCADIPTSGWIDFKGIEHTDDNKITMCHKEFNVEWKRLKKVEESINPPKPLICSFDIEVNSSNINAMPKAVNQHDKIFQISCVLSRPGQNEKDFKKYLLTLGDPDREIVGKDVTIQTYKTEVALLQGYVKFIQEHNPNLIAGYNILGFDIEYMLNRAQGRAPCMDTFLKQGFIPEQNGNIIQITWSSSAYGKQEFEFLESEGRLFVDLLPLVRRDYKMDNYKLKTISDYFLGETKDPLTAKGIFKCYKIGMEKKGGVFTDKAKKAMGVVGKYCVQDTVLVSKLLDTLQTWIGLSEMAKVCCVPIFTLYTQGQQIKVFSQVYKECYIKKYVVEKDGYVAKDNEHYQGAYVVDPVPGVYDRVIPFDFCLSGETLISTGNGLSKRIDMMYNDTLVLSCDNNRLQYNTSVNGLQKKGMKDTVKIYFQDGTSIISTPEHKFLLDTGKWCEAQNLNGNYVRCGIEYPEDTTCDMEKDWKFHIQNYEFDMKSKREHSLAFARILGYVLSDGSIYISKNRKCAEASFGTLFDAQTFKRDVGLFSSVDITIRKRQPVKNTDRAKKGCTFVMTLPSFLASMIHNVEGVVVGKRSSQPMTLPTYILEPNCPKSITREFLGGLFGGDGTAPYLASNNTFGTVSFKWTTIYKYLDDMQNCFFQLKNILEKFNIYCTIHKPIKITYGSNAIKPKDYMENPIYDVNLFIPQEYTVLYNDIGFRYCINKTCKLNIVKSYRYMEQVTREQHSKVLSRSIELINKHIGTNVFSRKKGNMTFDDCLQQARIELLENEPSINTYSLSSVQDISYQRGEAKRHADRPRRLSLQPKKFITPKQYATELGVLEWFLPKSYAVKQDNITIPTYRKKVIDIRPYGNINVYDIEVENDHNFVANSIITHNCSLYPTTIIAYNICWSTLVEDESIPDKDCHVIEWSDHLGCSHDTTVRKTKPKNPMCQDRRYRFLKQPIGILPNMLKYLLSARKQVKKEMKQLKQKLKQEYDTLSEDDRQYMEVQIAVLDKRQLSYKISSNSAYGALGVHRGRLPLMPGAMCTTAKGREAIRLAGKTIVDKHKGELVYGDSVTEDTPILCRINGKIYYKTIDDISKDTVWIQYHNTKQVSKPTDDIEVWTENGFTKIKKVIRHKTRKEIFRVLTHTGVVDVTEDHGLLNPDAEKVSPKNLKVGDALLTHSLPKCDDIEGINNFNILHNYTSTNKLEMAKLYHIATSVGYNVGIDIDDNGKYILNFNLDTIHSENIIKNIYSLGYSDEYVYDLETENHHFSAGIGKLIVHNTDSCYMRFPHLDEAPASELWDYSINVAQEVTKLYPESMTLEFEDVIYWVFLILTKKRYMSLPCDRDGNVSQNISKKGVLLARRDNSKFVRDVYADIIMQIFHRRTKDDVIYDLIQYTNQLFQYNTPIKTFVITKSVGDTGSFFGCTNVNDVIKKEHSKSAKGHIGQYKVTLLDKKKRVQQLKLKNATTDIEFYERSLPACVQLALKMMRRGQRVDPGTRLEYVITTDGSIQSYTKAKQWEKIEALDYYKDHSDILRLDPIYYLNALAKPVDEVMKIIYKVDGILKQQSKLRVQKIKIHNELLKHTKPKFVVK